MRNRVQTISIAKVSPFQEMRGYVSLLNALAEEPANRKDWKDRCHAALNGEASEQLRQIASIDIRRKFGVFFTGHELASQLIRFIGRIKSENFFYDPTCGMGDLLLAVAQKLPLADSLDNTLRGWGRQLAGTDLHSEFIEAAKARLKLLARHRHKSNGIIDICEIDYFPSIYVANGLSEENLYQQATHLLMNPPFGLVTAPPKCEWAGGRITEAALFMTTALAKVNNGTEILAILPEVLRSGSFSARWRKKMEELTKMCSAEPYGVFDQFADVDVFILRLIREQSSKSHKSSKWASGVTINGRIIDDSFYVHVGRVVPHRDKQEGPVHPYIHPRCIPTWAIVSTFDETRKHMGLVYKPPFVVIRRTSRPGHTYRASATIISGDKPVAVENHLIVCEPKDRKLVTCKKLMKHLKSEAVNTFLDERIRCRHLTVAAVQAIPFNAKA